MTLIKTARAFSLLAVITAIQVSTLTSAYAHDPSAHSIAAKEWQITGQPSVAADFIKLEDSTVYLTDSRHQLLSFVLADFSADDQAYILEKNAYIQAINQLAVIERLVDSNQLTAIQNPSDTAVTANDNGTAINKADAATSVITDNSDTRSVLFFYLLGSLVLASGLVCFYVLNIRHQKNPTSKMAYSVVGVLGSAALLVACSSTETAQNIGAKTKEAITHLPVPANDIDFMTSVFGSFDNVSTRHDDKYLYVESNGIPSHEMMTGITSWQQQVPIDHDYTDDNSWVIPLQPELADEPLMAKDNFMKGAIAIAANGIPIFNPLNNRGEDAKAFGELDHWGGHSGRADDYHYHLAPTHLQSQVGAGKPIAYALDGFPVYGETDDELDEYLGKFNEDGSYEYHAISEFPYLIAGLRGKVTINPDTTAPENEISPQAHTRGVRPALTPLRGAEITDYKIISPTQYSLTYTHDGQEHKLNYGWGATEATKDSYTFEFIDPEGTTVQTYKRNDTPQKK